MTSRKFFMLFIACALIPIVAAKMSLSQGWFQEGSTNKGQWLQHEIQLLPDANSNNNHDLISDVHWHLVYVQGTESECAKECEQVLFTLQQLYAGMGRKQIKIKPLIMAQQKPLQLNQFPAIGWLPEPAAAAELENQIVIVNQRGLVLLRYTFTAGVEQLNALAKDIRTDLLRLINYDRSGA